VAKAYRGQKDTNSNDPIHVASSKVANAYREAKSRCGIVDVFAINLHQCKYCFRDW